MYITVLDKYVVATHRTARLVHIQDIRDPRQGITGSVMCEGVVSSYE